MNIKIDASVHASSQAKDRRPEFSKSDWIDLHKKTCAKIDEDGLYDDGWKLFYSKSMQQGYICMMKYIAGKDLLNIKVVTVLPKGKNNPQGGNNGGQTELELMEMEINIDEIEILLGKINLVIKN